MKNFESFRNELNDIKADSITSQATISTEDSNKLIAQVQSDAPGNFTETEAAVGICIICQKGGTAKRAQGNIYAIINSKRLDLETIRKSLNKTGCN